MSEEPKKLSVSKEEWQVRVDLTACYNIVANYGWDDLIFTHIPARFPGQEQHFLIKHPVLMLADISASDLVKVDMFG